MESNFNELYFMNANIKLHLKFENQYSVFHLHKIIFHLFSFKNLDHGPPLILL